MRILMISGTAGRVSAGDTIHTLELAGALAASGARVTLVMRGISPSAGRGGLRVVAVPAFRSKPADMLLRPVLFGLTVFWLALRSRYDAAYVRDSVFEMPAVKLLGLTGLPLLLEVNAVTSADLLTGGRKRWKTVLASWVQRKSCRGADAVLPVTTNLARWLRGMGVPAERVAVVPNGVNPGLYYPMDRKEAMAALGLDPLRRYFCFAGNLAAWQGGGMVLEAFSRLARRYPDAGLLVVGDGSARKRLEKQAAGGPGRIVFTGLMPYHRVPVYINACVAGIGGGWQKDDPLLRQRYALTGSSALKVFSYLACAVPVIIPDIPDLAAVVRRRRCGLVADARRVDELERAMRAVLEYPGHWAEAGWRGRAFVEREAAWAHRARRVLSLAVRLIGERR